MLYNQMFYTYHNNILIARIYPYKIKTLNLAESTHNFLRFDFII